MSAPTTITFTYVSTLPSTTSTVTIPIPTYSAGSVGGAAQTSVPQEVSVFMKQIYIAGGFWFTNSSGVEQFCPWGQIVGATAQ